MRDLLLLCLLPLMLYAMAQRPFIAAGMWLWTAMFFPNGWVYGFASAIRYNLLFAGVGFLAYLAYKHKPKIRLEGLSWLVMAFFAWTTLSSAATIGNSAVAWEYWNRFLTIVLLFVFIVVTIKDKLHLDFVLWCVLLSVGFYANLEGLKYLASGGGHEIAGMGKHILGDRNALAMAFVMTLPLCHYLQQEYGKVSKFLKLALIGTMGLLVIAVIGTMSRGGFVALVAVAGYFYLKSDRKILWGVLGVLLLTGLSFVVTSEWSSRMDTITAAGDDNSFTTRLVAWKLSFIMAMQHPFFGGGFKALEYGPVWNELSRDFFSYPWFYTGDRLPNPQYPRAAHSIYFQTLGDHGFVGLALYVGCMVCAFFKAGRIARRARRMAAPAWIFTAASMLQLSIFAFALGGAALSLAYFDLIFALYGLVVVLDTRVLPLHQGSQTSSQYPRQTPLAMTTSAVAQPTVRSNKDIDLAPAVVNR